MRINKRGSYLTEAAISLPVFIIAVIVMSSVILMYACIEDCTFIAAGERRRGAAEAVMADTSIALPHRIRKEIEDNHSQVHSAKLIDAGFRCERWGIDELLLVDYRLSLKTNNPLGIKAEADYDLAVATRAYVGRERDETPVGDLQRQLVGDLDRAEIAQVAALGLLRDLGHQRPVEALGLQRGDLRFAHQVADPVGGHAAQLPAALIPAQGQLRGLGDLAQPLRGRRAAEGADLGQRQRAADAVGRVHIDGHTVRRGVAEVGQRVVKGDAGQVRGLRHLDARF